MVWPPSVRGILVTEAVRGEGGVLLDKDGKRFMFDDIPENYRGQTADNEDEGWRYTQGDKDARRPPELLTRDHVARCIVREVKAGGAAPTAGCSSTSPDQEASAQREEHIRRSCPACTSVQEAGGPGHHREPMEIGPTTHYVMGGVRVDADTQMSRVRVCSPPGSARPGSTEPTGSAATRCLT